MSSEQERKIELHLHPYVKEFSCPFKFTVDPTGEIKYQKVLIFLSREKFITNGNETDVKYYYNCLLAESCNENRCTLRKSKLMYELKEKI